MPETNEAIFYVYEHWRPDRDECFYVGKGHGGRANLMSTRNAHHKNIQAKLARMGMCVEVRMIAVGLTSGAALSFEVERIAFWRADGAELANLTIGGEGASGLKRSDEWKKSVGDRHRQKFVSKETREKISAANVGRIVSVETKLKMSASAQKSWTPERRAEKSLAQKGKKHSDASKQKMKNQSEERRSAQSIRTKEMNVYRWTPELRIEQSKRLSAQNIHRALIRKLFVDKDN